jgi:ubiquitin-activating enzyme E1
MEVLITGPSGTPYAYGTFIYKVTIPSNYPISPPKVILSTTGGGSVRFNPNLYSWGKVCLSLLGTWLGSGGENWTPTSNLMQVFLSIQSIVMNEKVM